MPPSIFFNGFPLNHPVLQIPDLYRGCPAEMQQFREVMGKEFYILETDGGHRYYAKTRKELEDAVMGEPKYRYAIIHVKAG